MIPYKATRSLMNNQLAAGTTAGKTQAGGGLSRGAGQRSADQYQAGVARAGAEGEAGQTKNASDMFNQAYGNQQRNDLRNQRLQYDTLSQRAINGAWDSRFSNLTTAWGALAGLLR